MQEILRKKWNFHLVSILGTLFRKKRFELNKMLQRNAAKYLYFIYL